VEETVSRPIALVVQAPGTNRDGDVALALELAGAQPQVVLLTELVADPSLADEARIMVLPGGFSYADSLGAGRMFALQLTVGLGDVMAAHIDAGRPVIGICNGFQTLVRAGLLPGGGQRAALGHNDSGQFTCRWVRLAPVSQRCVWTNGLDGELHCPIAHGEGRFTCDEDTLTALAEGDRIALRYLGGNPNGSVDAIAGVCDSTGLVLGLMPHPENHVLARQHPDHRRLAGRPVGLALGLFVNGVEYARQS
jgi:phosphoribosylformylglycinamidine synthase